MYTMIKSFKAFWEYVLQSKVVAYVPSTTMKEIHNKKVMVNEANG